MGPNKLKVEEDVTTKDDSSVQFLSFLNSSSIRNKSDSSPRCIICSEITNSTNPKLRPLRSTKRRKRDIKSSMALDKMVSILHFISFNCLGLKLSRDEIQTDLNDSSEFLCEEHNKLIENGLELDKLIKEMTTKLESIKKIVQEGIGQHYISLGSVKVEPKVDYEDYVDHVHLDFCEIDPLAESDFSMMMYENSSCPSDESMPIQDLPKLTTQAQTRLSKRLKIISTQEMVDINMEDSDNGPDNDPDFVLDDDIPSIHSDSSNNKNVIESDSDKKQLVKDENKKQRRRRQRCVQSKRTKHKNRISCQICKQSFTKVLELKSHRLNEHGEDGPNFPCYLCAYGSNKKSRLNDHITRVHSGNEPSFLCDQCPKTYLVSENLQAHKKQMHSAEAVKIIACPYCTTGKKYKGVFNLNAHIRVQHSKEPKPVERKKFICELCGKAYTSVQDLKQHMQKVHLNTHAPSICDICGKKLSDSKSLKKHRLSQHQKSYQYKCELCGSGSLFKSHLIAHYKQTHPHLTEDELDGFTKNCTKVIDNTNPIYREEEKSQEN